MSTFDGHIREFPDIQVDYFRTTHTSASRRPLACFLSHAHSDHLVGLDTLRSPFVYCSAATRAIVLRLEKYHCRVNFAKGILEARERTYKHLKHLLVGQWFKKPLPLDTPTTLELSPGHRIQVTLFDANHCPGSVMFLFEDDKKSALYTGDTRLEPWFVNALVSRPCLAQYAAGLRTIDTVYLDTSFSERDVVFEPKAEGLKQLLQTVASYPLDTIFYLHAWTFGYEEVWTALAKALRSKIHVDEYKMRLYKSLSVDTAGMTGDSEFGDHFVALDPVASSLVGFACANTFHKGCLTTEEAYNDQPVRIHSCEKGLGHCRTIQNTVSQVVWISPIVCRLPYGRGEMTEVGVGGGGDDLNKEADLKAKYHDEIARLREIVSKREDCSPEEMKNLDFQLCESLLENQEWPIPVDVRFKKEMAPEQRASTSTMLVSVEKLAKVYHAHDHTRTIKEPTAKKPHDTKHISAKAGERSDELPRTITFPYSRHSSYAEQCDLLDKLRPRDVWPCTVNAKQWFGHPGHIVTIAEMFGRFCSGNEFRHDIEVASHYLKQDLAGEAIEILDSQIRTDSGHESQLLSSFEMHQQSHLKDNNAGDDVDYATRDQSIATADKDCDAALTVGLTDYPYFYNSKTSSLPDDSDFAQDSQTSQLSDFSLERRSASHQAAVVNAVGAGDWMHIRLASTTDNHTMPDVDLGSDR